LKFATVRKADRTPRFTARHGLASLAFMIARITALLMLMLAAPLAAQVTPPPAAPSAVRVTIATSAGPIVVALDRAHAPVTTANFLRYVDAKRFDGTSVYRAMTIAPGSGLIQGGQRDPRKLYPSIAHEPTSTTGLTHGEGTISMARGAPGSATADFFITMGAMNGLDASATDPGFAAFGTVVEGLDVVRAIMAAPTSPTQGEGPMKGQMLSPVVRVVSVRRTP